MTPAERVQARRVFEEALVAVQAQYALMEDVLVEARMADQWGRPCIVARYKLHVDGQIECFEILDEVLWPTA